MKTLLPAALLMAQPVLAQLCGGQLKPLKPLTPFGCSDTAAVCLCDVNGNNCQWKWECTNKTDAGGPPAWSIPLMGQAPKIMSPLEVANQAEQLRQMRLQTELLRRQLEEQKRQAVPETVSINPADVRPVAGDVFDTLLKAAPPAQPVPAGASSRTGGRSNGVFWRGLGPGAKLAYLFGLSDALLRDVDVFEKQFPVELRFFQVVAAVDRFYENTDNLVIPVPDALRDIRNQAAGAK